MDIELDSRKNKNQELSVITPKKWCKPQWFMGIFLLTLKNGDKKTTGTSTNAHPLYLLRIPGIPNW